MHDIAREMPDVGGEVDDILGEAAEARREQIAPDAERRDSPGARARNQRIADGYGGAARMMSSD